ncbi:hypothetical protein RhiirA4_482956, partial [Rhizophagus irregularis]
VEVEQIDNYKTHILSKKILVLRKYHNYWLIDLNSDRTSSSDRFLKLEYPISCECDAIGFLPNGDLINVSTDDRKIYKYCFTDKPKNTDPWECSQINKIEIPESFDQDEFDFESFIYQTKLFIIFDGCETLILQFDLLEMNLERQYITCVYSPQSMPVMNKNQTLLAYYSCIFSMEDGMLILNENYGCDNRPVEFITLKNNSERLVIDCRPSSLKLVDPYQTYGEIDIDTSSDFNDTNVITKLNRKIFIDNGNVRVTNGLDESKLKELSNKITDGNSIYTSTFKIIRSMFEEIIKQTDIRKAALPNEKKIILKDKVKVEDSDLHEFVLRPNDTYDEISLERNDICEKSLKFSHVLSYKLLKNQDLVLITMEAIEIYSLNENFINRYFWNNNEWNNIYKLFVKGNEIYDSKFINEHYKQIFKNIVENEFDKSNHSIPFPNIMEQSMDRRKEIAEDVINDDLASSKFRIEIIEMLKTAIDENCDEVVRPFINNTIESIEDHSVNSMTFISLNLAKLCDDCPDYIIKYILHTSIILSPYCDGIENSENTWIHSYTNIFIKESHMDNNIFKSINKWLTWHLRNLRIKEKIQVVRFIVPFPQICVYQNNSKNNNYENHETENNNHENHNSKNNDNDHKNKDK